jgi:hypothetical protein
MIKPDAEKIVRSLCHEWLREAHPNLSRPGGTLLDAGAFLTWLRSRRPDVFTFRSTLPVNDMIEQWFDHELDQTWRN